MAKDRARDPKRQFKNDDVIDLGRTRALKELRMETGQGSKVIPVPLRPLEKSEIMQRLKHTRLIAGPGWMGENDGKE